MAKRIWTFSLEDGQHTVELEHGYFSGKRIIRVDGNLIERSSKVHDLLMDTGSEHPFEVSGHPCIVTIRFKGVTYSYDLIVDGRSMTTGQSIEMKPRPWGISPLAVLHILGGAAFLVVQLFFGKTLDQAANMIGVSSALLSVSTVFLALLNLAAGIGLWIGKPWGWWLAAFYYIYDILRNANTILLMSGIVKQYGAPTRGVGYYYTREVWQSVIGILLILYLYRRNIREYFGLGQLSKLKSGALLIGTSIAVVAMTAVLSPSLPSTRQDLDAIATIYKQGDTQTAVNKLKQYLESNPRDTLAWTILGNACLDLNADGEAEAAYKQAVEINPKQFQALTGLGVLARKQGNYDQAMSYYQKAVEANPKHAQAYSSMAIIALKQNQDTKALEYAKKAYELEKNDSVVVANLAIAYHYNGLFDLRDKMTEEAQRLGYHNLEVLQRIYRGELTIRD